MSEFMLLGFLGAAGILLAYAQVSRGAWKAKGAYFQIANLIGAGLLTYYSVTLKAYPMILLNGVWCGIALVALLRLGRYRTNS